MDYDNKVFGGIITVIMIITIVWSASILLIENNNPSRFDFLTEEQTKSIKHLESLCSDYSATSKISCMKTIDIQISKYQIEGAAKNAIQNNDVTICHLISSDIDCLFKIAQISNNKDACHEIVNSHEKKESSEENNREYLKSLSEYCLSKNTSS